MGKLVLAAAAALCALPAPARSADIVAGRSPRDPVVPRAIAVTVDGPPG